MSDPAAVPPPPVLPPAPADPPKKRGWFVVLAWVTLVGFGIFSGAITVLAFLVERIAAAGGR